MDFGMKKTTVAALPFSERMASIKSMFKTLIKEHQRACLTL